MRILLLLLVALPLLSNAAIYKWKAPDGTIVFSDQPKEGAKKVDLGPAQVYSSPKVTNTQRSKRNVVQNQEGPRYQGGSIQFVKPENGSTFHNQNKIPMQVALSDNLRSGDRVQGGLKIALYNDDGNKQSLLGEFTHTTFDFPKVHSRGLYSLVVKVIDQEGRVITESAKPLVIYVHRHKVKPSS